MLDYLEYKLKRLASDKVKSDFAYPIYYEKNGVIIREEKDGQKFEIKLDKNYKETIIRKLPAK